MSNFKKECYTFKQYVDEMVDEPLEKFKLLTEWSEDAKRQYLILLDELKKPFDKNKETTKSKGDRLEKLVSFIIEKSYFFEMYPNVHTGTNEIDEVIILSDKGKQALYTLGISKDLLQVNSDVFIGECKNYDSKLNVTYVGKFYSLLVSTGVNFGIIFTQKGLTGNNNEYHDAYGLLKVLHIIEKSKNNRDLTIITFTLEDYEKIAKGISFFDIIKAKKLELRLAADYTQFLKEYSHDGENAIKEKIKSLS